MAILFSLKTDSLKSVMRQAFPEAIETSYPHLQAAVLEGVAQGDPQTVVVEDGPGFLGHFGNESSKIVEQRWRAGPAILCVLPSGIGLDVSGLREHVGRAAAATSKECFAGNEVLDLKTGMVGAREVTRAGLKIVCLLLVEYLFKGLKPVSKEAIAKSTEVADVPHAVQNLGLKENIKNLRGKGYYWHPSPQAVASPKLTTSMVTDNTSERTNIHLHPWAFRLADMIADGAGAMSPYTLALRWGGSSLRRALPLGTASANQVALALVEELHRRGPISATIFNDLLAVGDYHEVAEIAKEAGISLGDGEDLGELSELFALERRIDEVLSGGGDVRELVTRRRQLSRMVRYSGLLRGGDTLRAGPHHRGYRVHQKIGKGGFGEVWRATDQEHGVLVAIKVLRADRREEMDRVRQGLTVARDIRRRGCAAVVAAHGPLLEDGHIVFFAMDLLEGGTLACPADPRYHGPEHGLRLVLEAGDAVATAHQLGHRHRDLRPTNILINDTGHARLADFDLSQPAHTMHATGTGQRVGWGLVLPPELALRATEFDEFADQYMLATCLWFALGGRETPLVGTPQGLLDSAQKLRVPDELRAVLMRGLALDPKERYPSVALFLVEARRTGLRWLAAELRARMEAHQRSAAGLRERFSKSLRNHVAAVRAKAATTVQVECAFLAQGKIRADQRKRAMYTQIAAHLRTALRTLQRRIDRARLRDFFTRTLQMGENPDRVLNQILDGTAEEPICLGSGLGRLFFLGIPRTEEDALGSLRLACWVRRYGVSRQTARRMGEPSVQWLQLEARRRWDVDVPAEMPPEPEVHHRGGCSYRPATVVSDDQPCDCGAEEEWEAEHRVYWERRHAALATARAPAVPLLDALREAVSPLGLTDESVCNLLRTTVGIDSAEINLARVETALERLDLAAAANIAQVDAARLLVVRAAIRLGDITVAIPLVGRLQQAAADTLYEVVEGRILMAMASRDLVGAKALAERNGRGTLVEALETYALEAGFADAVLRFCVDLDILRRIPGLEEEIRAAKGNGLESLADRIVQLSQLGIGREVLPVLRYALIGMRWIPSAVESCLLPAWRLAPRFKVPLRCLPDPEEVLAHYGVSPPHGDGTWVTVGLIEEFRGNYLRAIDIFRRSVQVARSADLPEGMVSFGRPQFERFLDRATKRMQAGTPSEWEVLLAGES